MSSIAAMDVTEILRSRRVGETVNSHVVESVRQPAPDFDAMKRAVEGANSAASRIATENELEHT